MKKTLLLIDDPQGMLDDTGKSLIKAGYHIVRASEDEALARFSEVSPELIVIQLHGGGGGGVTVTEQVRQLPEGAIVPILFLGSGNEMVTSTSDALAVGGDYYFQRPIDLDKVVAKIRSYIGPGEDPTDSTDLAATDLAAHPVELDSEPVDLGSQPVELDQEATSPGAPAPAGFSSSLDDEWQELDFSVESTTANTRTSMPSGEVEHLRRAEEEVKRRWIDDHALLEAEAQARLNRETISPAPTRAPSDATARRQPIERDDANARAEAEIEALRRAEAEAVRRAEVKEQAERQARDRAQQEADERQATEARRLAAAEAEIRQRAEADARRLAAAEAEARQRADAEARRLAELEARHRADAEARRRADEEIKRLAEADAKRRADEATRRQEEELRRRAEEEAKRRAEDEARLRADEEVRRRIEEEARRRAEEENKRRAEETARKRAEEEAKRRIEEDAKRRVEEEAKRRLEEEARRRADDEAKKRTEDEIKRRVEEEAKRRVEEEARRRAEDDARRREVEETRRQAELEARRRSEEEIARRLEEARRNEEETARRLDEARRRLEEEQLRTRMLEEARQQFEIEERERAEQRRREEDERRQKLENESRNQLDRERQLAAEREDQLRREIEERDRRLEEEAKQRLELSDKRKRLEAEWQINLAQPGAVEGDVLLPETLKAPAVLSGELAEQDIAKVLAGFVREGITGKVRFTKNNTEKIVSFELGRPVAVTSSEPSDRFEEFLYRSRLLTRQQYQTIRLHQLPNPRTAAAFITAEGYLKSQELFEVVRQHLEESFHGLFEWQDGFYLYLAESIQPEDRIVLQRSPERLIVDGVRRRYLLDRLIRQLGSPSSLLIARPGQGFAPDQWGLDAKERQIFRLLDGSRSIEDLVFTLGLSEERVYQILHALEALGQVEVVVRGIGGDGNDDMRGNDIDRARIKEQFELAKKADYFEFLGLPLEATEFAIEHALSSTRKAFSKTHFSPEVAADLVAELGEIERVLSDAEYVLKDSRLRDAYVSHTARRT